MADISHIKGPDNTSYDIKDATARSDISNLARVASTGEYSDLLHPPTVAEIDDNSTANNKAWSASNINSKLNNPVTFRTDDIPEEAANLSTTATAHRITAYQNGLSIPYKGDNTNDGGILRVRGKSESDCILELGTWDDSGTGETIQFNYYPATSQVTPTYSVSVPKKSGTIALTSDVDAKVSKSGDTMTGKLEFVNTSRNIEVPARAISYVDGAKGNAGIYMPHTYNKDEWGPLATIQTKTGGSWQIGNYNNDHLSFVKFTKANIDSTTNTMQCQIDLAETGSVETVNGSFVARDNSNPASPSSGSLYGKGFYLRDAANDDYAYLRHHYSGAEKGLQIEVRRSINGSYVYNTLNMRINASGGRVIQVSDGAAWRSAIGANIALSTSEISYTRSHASVSTDWKAWRYGNVVTLGGYFACGATIAANTILYSGLPKPKNTLYFTWTGRDFNLNSGDGTIRTNGQIVAGTYNVCLTYVCV